VIGVSLFRSFSPIFEFQVMDFGLSRLVKDGEKNLTRRIGTSSYMAPEVMKDSTVGYDSKVHFSFSIQFFFFELWV